MKSCLKDISLKRNPTLIVQLLILKSTLHSKGNEIHRAFHHFVVILLSKLYLYNSIQFVSFNKTFIHQSIMTTTFDFKFENQADSKQLKPIFFLVHIFFEVLFFYHLYPYLIFPVILLIIVKLFKEDFLNMLVYHHLHYVFH